MAFQVVAHPHLRRRHERDVDVVELRQQIAQRPDRATVREVADHRDPRSVDVPQLVLDRVEVEQRLGRMLAAPVTPVDHRHVRDQRRPFRGALLVVPDDDHVGVAGDDADRVLQRLALGGARELPRVVGAHHPSAEAKHGRLEREPGAGGGLVEEGRHDLPLEPAGGPGGVGAHLVGAHEDGLQQRPGELLRGDHMVQAFARGNRGEGHVSLLPGLAGPDLKGAAGLLSGVDR